MLEERRRQQIINSGSARTACISEMEGRWKQEHPRRHAHGQKRNSTKVGPIKRTTLKANLSSEEWIRKPNWVHITKNHMYPKKKDKGVFYSKDLKEIRELCRATLLNPDLEKMDKNYPDRRKLKRKFRHAVGEDGLMGCKCYFVTVIYDRMENEVVTAFPSLY